VVCKCNMVRDTAHVAVNYLDNYLAKNPALDRGKLQAVGAACLITASEVLERWVFTAKSAHYVSDKLYTEDEMEDWVLKVKQQVVPTARNVMTSRTALKRVHPYVRRLGINGPAEACAHYICDIALLDVGTQNFSSVVIATSAIELARYTLGASAMDWAVLPFKEPEIRCMEALVKAFSQRSTETTRSSGTGLVQLLVPKLTAVDEDYDSAKQFEVSKLLIKMPPASVLSQGFRGGERVRVPRGIALAPASD